METGTIMISRKWRPGKVRPVQGNPPHDRPVSRGIFSSLQESLRRSLECHSCLYTEAPQYAFSQARRNLPRKYARLQRGGRFQDDFVSEALQPFNQVSP
jgi:hypothetical protein